MGCITAIPADIRVHNKEVGQGQLLSSNCFFPFFSSMPYFHLMIHFSKRICDKYLI